MSDYRYIHTIRSAVLLELPSGETFYKWTTLQRS